MVQGQPQCNRHLLRERRAGRASQEQCRFRRRKPILVAEIRVMMKGFVEKAFVLILKVWTDRNEIHPKQREPEGQKHYPRHA